MRTLLIWLLSTSAAHAVFVTPHFGVMVAIEDREAGPSVPFSIGGAVQPRGRDQVVPFLGVALDLELYDDGLSYAPMLRVGLLVRSDEDEYVAALLSYVQLYAIAGYRLPGGALPAGARVGVGITSPIGGAITLQALEAGVPIPNSVELVVDGFEYGEPVATFRLGLAL